MALLHKNIKIFPLQVVGRNTYYLRQDQEKQGVRLRYFRTKSFLCKTSSAYAIGLCVCGGQWLPMWLPSMGWECVCVRWFLLLQACLPQVEVRIHPLTFPDFLVPKIRTSSSPAAYIQVGFAGERSCQVKSVLCYCIESALQRWGCAKSISHRAAW